MDEEARLVEKRRKRMRCLVITNFIIIITSVVCMIVGSLAIVQSAPEFQFPFCLGGAMIAGVFSLLNASCHMCLYRKGDTLDYETVQRWLYKMIFIVSFMWLSLLCLGLGISGIWGMVAATHENYDEEQGWYVKPYRKANLLYAITTFLLSFVLTVLQTICACTCLSFIETYGFGGSTYTNYRYATRSTYAYSNPVRRKATEDLTERHEAVSSISLTPGELNVEGLHSSASQTKDIKTIYHPMKTWRPSSSRVM